MIRTSQRWAALALSSVLGLGFLGLGCGAGSWNLTVQKRLLSMEPGQAKLGRARLRQEVISFLRGERAQLSISPEALTLYAIQRLERSKDEEAYALLCLAGYLSKRKGYKLRGKSLRRLLRFSRSSLYKSRLMLAQSQALMNLSNLSVLKKIRKSRMKKSVGVLGALMASLRARREDGQARKKLVKSFLQSRRWFKPGDNRVVSLTIGYLERETRQSKKAMAEWALRYLSEIPDRRVMRTLIYKVRRYFVPFVFKKVTSFGKVAIPLLLKALDPKYPKRTTNALIALARLRVKDAASRITGAVGETDHPYIRMALAYYRIYLGLAPLNGLVAAARRAAGDYADFVKVKRRKKNWAERRRLSGRLQFALTLLQWMPPGKLKAVPVEFLISIMAYRQQRLDFWVSAILRDLKPELTEAQTDRVLTHLKSYRFGLGGRRGDIAKRFGAVLAKASRKHLVLLRKCLKKSRRNGRGLALLAALGKIGDARDFKAIKRKFRTYTSRYASSSTRKTQRAFNVAVLSAAASLKCRACRKFLLRIAEKDTKNLGLSAVFNLLKWAKTPEMRALADRIDAPRGYLLQMLGNPAGRSKSLARLMGAMSSSDSTTLSRALTVAGFFPVRAMRAPLSRLLVYTDRFPFDKYIRNSALRLLASLVLAQRKRK